MSKVNEEKITVLLIEDNPGDIRLIKQMLTEQHDDSFNLEDVNTLSKGLERLYRADFDVILLDLGLPDSFGLKTFNETYKQAPRIPIVVLSGGDDESLAIEALHYGAQDYLVKGQINSNSLRRVLRYSIERQQIQESLWIKNRIIESSVNSIATTDLQGKLTYVNDSFLKLWEYESFEEIAGSFINEFWAKTAGTLSIMNTVLEDGNWIGKIRSVGNNGAELNLQLSAFVVKEKNNKPVCLVFSFVDITELSHLRHRLKTEQSFAGIVGHDTKILELFNTIREVAAVNVPVLIQGERGTGKELVAAAIHNEGALADKPFVPVNCAALPEGVLESELFGHVKGAFTGAVRDRKGRFELADGGTIFLDEIGDIPPAMQAKLLRVLQESTFQRVGGEELIKVDVRVISATNKNLAAEVAKGNFREDLFYRLCVVPIELPALRQRRNDIPLLADHLLRKAQANTGRKDIIISHEAIDAMMDYNWPGNIRELENALRYALVKCRGAQILPEHLPLKTVKTSSPAVPAPTRKRKRKLDAYIVQKTLEETGGNKLKAAEKLEVARATLYRFLEDHQ